MFEIVFSDKALKQLKKLEKQIQKRIVNALERIRIRPEAHLTKLVDDPGYKLRIGDYRVVYTVDKTAKKVTVIKIRHRRDVYR